jgi:hypothetical protein
MLKYSIQVLEKVSFDESIFKKELEKSIKWVKNKEIALLKYWCFKKYFTKHPQVLEEVFKMSI